MDLRESNPQHELTELLSTEYAKLASFNVSIKHNDLYSLHGPMQMMGLPSAEIQLLFYMDQLSKQEFPYAALEKHISQFLDKVNGVFTARNLKYDSDNIEASYTIKLYNYNQFIESLHQLYVKRIDREFTKALEEKLSED